MKKRILGLLIALVMVVSMLPTAALAAEEDYGIWIGGVLITESNKDNLVQAINDAAGSEVASGSATYDSNGERIILENFSYTGTGYKYAWSNTAAIYSTESVNIVVVGDNKIVCTGDGSCYGIRSEDSISIWGNDAANDKLYVQSEYATILTPVSLDIESMTLSIKSEYSCGIDMWGYDLSVYVNDSIVYMDVSYEGIYMNEYDSNGTVTISDSTFTVAAEYYPTLYCSKVIVDGPAYVLAGNDETDADYANPFSKSTYENRYLKIVGKDTENLSITRDGVTEYFSSLEDASMEAEPGDVIKVEHDYVEMYPEINLYSWYSYTIDLNGHEIHFEEYYGEDFGAMYYEASGPMALPKADPGYGILTLTDSVGGGVIHALISVEGGLRIDSGTYGGIIAPEDTQISGGTFTGLSKAAVDNMMEDPSMAMFANMVGTKSLLHASFFDFIDNEAEAREKLDSIFPYGYYPNKDYEVYVTQSGYYLVGLPANTTILEAYNVILDYGNGEVEGKKALAETFTEPTPKMIPGKIFMGWYDDAEFTTTHDFSAPLASDITLYAKLADYEKDQKELQDAIDALEGAVETVEDALANKADAATTTKAIQELRAAVAALESVKDDYLAADEELENKITDAQTAAISAAETLVGNAKTELKDAIDGKADAATTTKAIQELQAAVAALESVKDDYLAADEELENKITDAQAAAISAAETLVGNAKTELKNAIDSKADAATVNTAIANLNNAIAALEDVKNDYASADAALKAELEEAIAKAKQEAIEAAKGHIPYIGANGNWWIGDTDTGVDANGIKGDTGNGIASITTQKANGVTTITITFTDPEKEPVVFTISDGGNGNTGSTGVGVANVEKTATNGNVDTYTITLTNGKTFTFTVTNGTNGANGENGANGKDGQTPYIGENGNWWIGETDTGVKAAAAEGKDGATLATVLAVIALAGNIALAAMLLLKKKR